MTEHTYLEDSVQEKTIMDSDRKIVFLIGDSIRMGYCHAVKEELQDVADVVFPDENCRFTQNVIVSLNKWAGMCEREKVSLVQFNCGHWDAAHWNGEDVPLNSIPVYKENIARIIRRLRITFPNAKIVFATTTPINPAGFNGGLNPRTTEDIIRYNEAALEAAEEAGILVNDLFAFTKDCPSSCYRDYCHYTPEHASVIGKHVAEYIRKLL